MMPDCARDGGVLTIGNAKLFSGFLHNSGQMAIMSVTYKRAQMMHDVMIEATRKPAHDRIRRCIVGCGCKNVIHTVVKLAAVRGKVRAVESVGRLEDHIYR